MTSARLGVAFGILFALSLVTTRFAPPAPLPLTSGIAPVTRLVFALSTNLRRAGEAVVETRDEKAENARLRQRVARLESENLRLTSEVSRLEQVARIRAAISPAVVMTASVTSLDPSPVLSRLTLDRGAADGVRLMMPVTVPEGLVGVVTQVARNAATVRTIVDPESVIGVTVAGKGGRATARGVAGGRLRAEGFAKSLDVRVGDVILSSNALGGVFPTIPVGRVDQVLPAGSNALGRTVFIQPAVDVGRVELVHLLRAP